MARMRASRAVLTAVVILCAGVFAGGSPAGQSVQPQVSPNFAPVDAAMRRDMTRTSAPGATIAVVSGDRVVYTRGFGVANVETGEPMRPEMLFRLGSTTKMFTAAAVVLLAEQGKLSLSEPIGKHIPGLTPKLAALTAHQLLSHTSGILDEAPMFGSHDDEALRTEVGGWNDDRFFAEPSQIYSYSNPGYWLAGLLAETVGGQPFADQVATSLFAPLGMQRSTFRPTLAMTYPLAQGHELAGSRARIIRPAANNSASWPAGSIYSNVIDLSRWMTAFLNAGQIDGEQVLPAALFTTLTAPRARIPGAINSYGYGVQVGQWHGFDVVEHNGSRAGYGSMIRMLPSRRIGVVVIANLTGATMSEAAEAAIAALVGPIGMNGRVATPVTLPTDARRAFVGTYSQGARQMAVVERDDTLVLRQGTRETPLELVTTGGPDAPQNERVFRAGTTRYVFVLNDAGAVTFLHSGGRSWRKSQ